MDKSMVFENGVPLKTVQMEMVEQPHFKAWTSGLR